MRVSSSSKFAVLTLTLAIPSFLFADYTYQETTQITGGSVMSMMKMAGAFSSQARKAGEPVVSTVYIKDNRMAKVSTDSIEIIDLDKETITHVDALKHTYTVMTFEQMRQQMEQARQELQKRQAEHANDAPAPNPDANDVKMSFDVKVRKTGAEKQISGLDSKEAILTMTMNATDQKTQQTGSMAITNDMWMVPAIPGYDQVRDFYKRMAEKMGPEMASLGLDLSKMLAQNPGAGQALGDMGKEMQKLDGVPVMQIMRMGTTMNGQPLPAASEAPLPPDATPAMPSAGDVAKQSAASALASHFGLGGFSHKTTKNDPPPANQNSNQNSTTPPPTAAILMESQTTTSKFSSDPVDSSHFDVPAGYKQIQTQMEKR
jgi:hypothetical protein